MCICVCVCLMAKVSNTTMLEPHFDILQSKSTSSFSLSLGCFSFSVIENFVVIKPRNHHPFISPPPPPSHSFYSLLCHFIFYSVLCREQNRALFNNFLENYMVLLLLLVGFGSSLCIHSQILHVDVSHHVNLWTVHSMRCDEGCVAFSCVIVLRKRAGSSHTLKSIWLSTLKSAV